MSDAKTETLADHIARVRNTPFGRLTEDEIDLLDPEAQKFARQYRARRAREEACPGHEAENTGTYEQSRRGWHPAHCKNCGLDMSIDSGD